MSDLKLKTKLNHLVLPSGFTNKENMLCPLRKIIQMRYKDVDKEQAFRVARLILEEI